MNTAELKSNLYKLIESINDSKTLNAIYTLLSKSKTENVDWRDELSAEQKEGIEEGLVQADRGEVFLLSKVIAEGRAIYKK